MELEKVRTLGDSGRFDLSCECTTKEARQKYTEDSISQAALKGVYTAHITDGRTVKIFKTLMSNACTHDCNYCHNSTTCTKKGKKFQYTPAELAKVFMHLVKHNDIHGLFLSSGIVKDADYTTDMMLDAVKIVRNKYKFKGYVHFKALPGVSFDKLKQAREYASRMSINIEATSAGRLDEFTSIKEFKTDILRRQSWIKRLSPQSGQSTQLVVGAAGETDKEVLKMMRWEYDNMSLHRMYYSGFNPLRDTVFESKKAAPKWRAQRLYNVDWLYRVYNYKFGELNEVLDDEGMLQNKDPKTLHAQKFMDRPVDVKDAGYEELIRVPGIGPKTAKRIINVRRSGKNLKREHIHNAGAILKRADPFIKVDGWVQKRLRGW
ncbi:radical SAM protein [Candidatus Woesearchaeota archaeon]|nr:radical SAM protein [Candidatus Woesearchaeota archaeon]